MSALAVIASRESNERRGNLNTVIPGMPEGSSQRVIPSEAEGRVEGSNETHNALLERANEQRETKNEKRKPGDLLYERQLQVIARCIDLSPSVASYHFHYALTMRMVLPSMTIPAIRYLLSEYKKASELRPANTYFRSTYQKYEERYGAGK